MNNMELTSALVTSPSAAFADLRDRPRFLFPLLVLILSTAAVLGWYYSIVDVPWLMDQLLSSNPHTAGVTDQQRAAAMNAMSRSMFLWSSVIGGTVAIAVVRLLEAVYYLLAAKITNVQYGFKHWFALSCWASLPQVVGTVSMALYMATAGTSQIGPGELSLLSFNELFFHIPMGGKGFSLASALTLLHPWTWWLSVVAVKVWSQRTWTFAAVFSLLPVVIVYGVWAVLAMR